MFFCLPTICGAVVGSHCRWTIYALGVLCLKTNHIWGPDKPEEVLQKLHWHLSDFGRDFCHNFSFPKTKQPADRISPTLRILTPQKWRHFEDPQNTSAKYRFIHPLIGGSLGILRDGMKIIIKLTTICLGEYFCFTCSILTSNPSEKSPKVSPWFPKNPQGIPQGIPQGNLGDS